MRNQIRADDLTNNPSTFTIDGLTGTENHFFLQSSSFQGVQNVFKATLQIVYRKGGFVDRVCNYGLKELDDNGKSKPIYEDNGQTFVAKPWPLDDLGRAMAFSDDDAYVSEFYPYPDGVWGWFTTIMTPAANEIFGTEPVFG